MKTTAMGLCATLHRLNEMMGSSVNEARILTSGDYESVLALHYAALNALPFNSEALYDAMEQYRHGLITKAELILHVYRVLTEAETETVCHELDKI